MDNEGIAYGDVIKIVRSTQSLSIIHCQLSIGGNYEDLLCR